MPLFLALKRTLVVHDMMQQGICKILSLDTPNQIPRGSEILGDHVFVTLEYFSGTKECNEIG